MDLATARRPSHRKCKRKRRYIGQQGTASVGDDDAAMAMSRFLESGGGVRALVESGVTTVPPLFVAPVAPVSSAAVNFVVPSVDLSLPRSDAVALVRAAARSSGIFQLTNHGVPAATMDSALSVVRAFNEQPLAARSPFYSVSPVGAVSYGTHPIPRPTDGQPVTAPLLPWRDSLLLRFDKLRDPDLRNLPAACRDSLLEYHRALTRLGKEIAGLLSEGLGVGAERLDPVEGFLMQCHYHPPCPEPERVLGSREHTDGGLFTVLSQDGVGGLQVRLDGDEWVDVAPVAGGFE
ncbi:hypothetical protein PVAP13_5NG387700 [Panicum virgatum]|uniref:Fe2OG dioxygenase domain-containing protein n=1 Tax=Panicum virgatum TaxID=38727 RepID=A0A8T0RRS4_PANVG|nr:hypothetical protein PVAP13_5NG387700 [Panicum virgatum]